MFVAQRCRQCLAKHQAPARGLRRAWSRHRFDWEFGLFFGNSKGFDRQIKEMVAQMQPKPDWVVFDAEATGDADFTATTMLAVAITTLNEQGITFAIGDTTAGCRNCCSEQSGDGIGAAQGFRSGRGRRSHPDNTRRRSPSAASAGEFPMTCMSSMTSFVARHPSTVSLLRQCDFIGGVVRAVSCHYHRRMVFDV